MTVSELTALRHPGESTAESVLSNPGRRRRRDPDTGEEIIHLSLPDGAVWLTVGGVADLARYRMAVAGLPLDDGSVDTPMLELWLSLAPREPASGLRIAVLRTAGRPPAEIQRMLGRYLADETIVGVQIDDGEPHPGIALLALKSGAVELLQQHGHLLARTADIPVSLKPLISGRQQFTVLNDELEAWAEQFRRFFAIISAVSRQPIAAITGLLLLLGALMAALYRLGVL